MLSFHVDTLLQTIRRYSMQFIKDFGNWDKSIHDDTNQSKRLETAKKASCTPLNIDGEEGHFLGSSGNHTTSLIKCSCIDFNRRKKPCKHMYRLAMELGYIDCEFKSDIKSVKNKIPAKDAIKIDKAVENLEQLTLEMQQHFLHILYLMKYRNQRPTFTNANSNIAALLNDGFLTIAEDKATLINGLKKNDFTKRLKEYGIEYDKSLLKQDLFNWGIENETITLDMFPEYTTVDISPNYEKCMHKMYRYLSRKFDVAVIVTEDGEYIRKPKLETELPDDEITQLLIKNGYYKM